SGTISVPGEATARAAAAQRSVIACVVLPLIRRRRIGVYFQRPSLGRGTLFGDARDAALGWTARAEPLISRPSASRAQARRAASNAAPRFRPLGNGVTVAQQTLTLFV